MTAVPVHNILQLHFLIVIKFVLLLGLTKIFNFLMYILAGVYLLYYQVLEIKYAQLAVLHACMYKGNRLLGRKFSFFFFLNEQ